MINWREKFRAFAIHFLVTAVLGACAAALIFFVWFPSPFATMVGGTELFLLVVGCDMALGPLISLVIYNSRKSRRELITDYTIIGAVQLAALIYGVYSGSKFVFAGTPAGVTLSPEGGAHQSAITASIGMELPNLRLFEPCFARETEWCLLEGLRLCVDRSKRAGDRGLSFFAVACIDP